MHNLNNYVLINIVPKNRIPSNIQKDQLVSQMVIHNFLLYSNSVSVMI